MVNSSMCASACVPRKEPRLHRPYSLSLEWCNDPNLSDLHMPASREVKPRRTRATLWLGESSRASCSVFVAAWRPSLPCSTTADFDPAPALPGVPRPRAPNALCFGHTTLSLERPPPKIETLFLVP